MMSRPECYPRGDGGDLANSENWENKCATKIKPKHNRIKIKCTIEDFIGKSH